MLNHETIISRYDRPNHFQDIMLRGMFKTFEHDHYFDSQPDGTTVMRDELRFSAPLGHLGLIAKSLFLRRYLTGFLEQRNHLIKQVAEGSPEIWSRYVEPATSASNHT